MELLVVGTFHELVLRTFHRLGFNPPRSHQFLMSLKMFTAHLMRLHYHFIHVLRCLPGMILRCFMFIQLTQNRAKLDSDFGLVAVLFDPVSGDFPCSVAF